MTTTEELVDKLTVEDLAADDRFVALCNTWHDERHCPLVMPDFLRERGCERAAMVATWAVNHVTEKRGRLNPSVVEHHDSQTTYEFHRTSWSDGCSRLPEHERVDGRQYYNLHPSFTKCIADFLLNADPDSLFKLAPPKAEYSVIDNGGMLVAGN